jgi:AcrR family transcriptional regulator
MTRPSRNQDLLLIETAKRLLPETGVSGMSLKRIAEECGVNPGMFHYHFKTKSAFVRKVLESVNDEIQKEIEAGALQGDTSLERLRSAILAAGQRLLREKKILVSMIRDFLNGDEEVSRFIVHVHRQRLATIGPLIEQCRKDGYLEPIPLPQILSFIMCSVGFPAFIMEALDRSTAKKFKIPQNIKNEIASEEAIRQRVDLAIKAISKTDAAHRPPSNRKGALSP